MTNSIAGDKQDVSSSQYISRYVMQLVEYPGIDSLGTQCDTGLHMAAHNASFL